MNCLNKENTQKQTIKQEQSTATATKKSIIYRFDRRSFTLYYEEEKKNDDVGGAEKIFPSGIDDRDQWRRYRL